MGERVVLNECLLEEAPKSEAFVSVRLHLTVILSMFTHLDILLELLNLAILHLILKLHFSVLALELLYQERFQVVCLMATDGAMASRVDEVGLLLERPCQVFYIFLLLLKVYVHLLGLGSKSSVLIASNVVLDLQVAVHVANFFAFSRPEEGCLISFGDIGLLKSIDGSSIIGAPPRPHNWLLLYGHVATAAKENISRAIIMDDLLIYAAALLRSVRIAASFQ